MTLGHWLVVVMRGSLRKLRLPGGLSLFVRLSSLVTLKLKRASVEVLCYDDLGRCSRRARELGIRRYC